MKSFRFHIMLNMVQKLNELWSKRKIHSQKREAQLVFIWFKWTINADLCYFNFKCFNYYYFAELSLMLQKSPFVQQ